MAFYQYQALRTLEEAERQKTQVWRSAPGIQGSTVRPFIAGPPQFDYTQQPPVWRSAPGIQGRTVSPFTAGPPQFDPGLYTQVWRSVRPPPAAAALAGSIWLGTVQQAYVDVPSFVTRSSPGVQGPTLRQFTAGPAPFDWGLYSAIWPAARTPAVAVAVPGQFIGTPQAYQECLSFIIAAVQSQVVATAVVVQPSVFANIGGGLAWRQVQDRYWREIENRYKKKKREAEKKSGRAVELVERIAEQETNLSTAVEALQADLAEENIKQRALYVELLKLKLELAQADEEEEEAVMIAALYS